MAIALRTAISADIPQIEALIARSARGLSTADYRPSQIEAALRGAFGSDRQAGRDSSTLDPRTQAAKIRAFRRH
jgi:hypothetical protein